MYPRTEYEMTEQDLNEILEAIKPVPMIMVGGVTSRSPQARANSAWNKLGVKMGFDFMTVRPSGKGDRFFTAVPSETDQHRVAREKKEKEEKIKREIEEVDAQINLLQQRREKLLGNENKV